jgi:hypothetical protein
LAGKRRRKFLVALAIIRTSSYMNTCIKHLDKHFIKNSRPHICIHLFKTSRPIFYLSTTPLLWFPHGIWISSRDLWRHIFVTSFLHRVYDVIFLWRHFFSGFMTSYFCDVISSSGLWRHIFVTSFLPRVYDVIFLYGVAEFFVAKRTNRSSRILRCETNELSIIKANEKCGRPWVRAR